MLVYLEGIFCGEHQRTDASFHCFQLLLMLLLLLSVYIFIASAQFFYWNINNNAVPIEINRQVLLVLPNAISSFLSICCYDLLNCFMTEAVII